VPRVAARPIGRRRRRGCVVSGYHCFRRRSPDYCATTSGKVVQWRENHVLSGAPPR
jgi:hypothetical protein